MGHPPACTNSQCCSHFSSLKAKRKSNLLSGECSSSLEIGGTIMKCHRATNETGPHPIQLDIRQPTCTGVQCSKAAVVAMQGVLNCQDVDIRAINAMARFYLTLRPVKATRCSDLNSRPHVDDLGHTLYRPVGGDSLPPPQSPWDLGFSYTIDLAKASDIRKKLSFDEDIDEYVPKHFFMVCHINLCLSSAAYFAQPWLLYPNILCATQAMDCTLLPQIHRSDHMCCEGTVCWTL